MIKYVLETKTIEFKDQEWKQIKNNFLMESIKEGKKISPDQLIEEAFKSDTNKIVESMGKELKEKYPNCLAFSPIVVVEDITKDKAKAVVTIVIYPKAEFDKIDINIKPDGKYEMVTKGAIDEIYKKFVDDYPLLKEVEDQSKENDYVRYNISVSKDKKEILSRKDLDKKIVKDENPNSINSQLMNRKVNESFSVNTPENENIKITVTKVFRPIKTKLTNDNIKEIKIEGINTLDDLYNQLSMNLKNEMASSYLLDYMKKAIETVGNKYGFDLPPILLDTQVNDFIKSKLAMLPPDKANLLRNAIENKQKDGYEIFDLAKTNVRNSLLGAIIEFTFSLLIKNKITEKEAEEFYKSIKEKTLISTGSNELTKAQSDVILAKQKAALNLLYLNDKESYEAVSKDLELTI